MTEAEEKIYERGRRSVLDQQLGNILAELSYSSLVPSVEIGKLVREREAAIAQLRMLCEYHGDNNWNETLHLADIIEKHLGKYLEKE